MTSVFPPVTLPNDSHAARSAGERAEARVIAALASLPSPWQFFHTVEWRLLREDGEVIGEADAVVLHPRLGMVVLEVKAGSVSVQDGVWYYGSGQRMKRSPYSQARRNRYALLDKLKVRLGSEAEQLPITHAVWFPDIVWQGPVPDPDAPTRSFALDRAALVDPQAALTRLLPSAYPQSSGWTPAQLRAVKEVLAPDCRQLVPLASSIDDSREMLLTATGQQVAALRLLRTLPRLLVEGGAGSGKTSLAVTLACDHAAQGKRVLLTCFNRSLALYLQDQLAHVSGLTVTHFHGLVEKAAGEAGLPFVVPADETTRGGFFTDLCPELLLQAADLGVTQFDSIIVDEGADFLPGWWVALEAIGTAGFSWYCFYDTYQSIFQRRKDWCPPFASTPLVLDANLRNPRPIGEMSARLGKIPPPAEFRVAGGSAPEFIPCSDFAGMAQQLRILLRRLLNKEGILPEQVAVLSPYRHTTANALWAEGLCDVRVNADVARPVPGTVRVGTLQGFKGLEAEVVVLVGLDERAASQPELLYVGASRATGALFVLALQVAAPLLMN